MDNASQFKVIAAGIAISVFVALTAIIITGGTNACFTPQVAKNMEMAKANGCFEFWINRYQSLVAAFLGLATALYVVRPVIEQLRIMRRQMAVQMRGIADEHLRELKAEICLWNEARSHFETIAWAFSVDWDDPRVFAEWEMPRKLMDANNALRLLMQQLRELSENEPEPKLRSAVIDLFRQARRVSLRASIEAERPSAKRNPDTYLEIREVFFDLYLRADDELDKLAGQLAAQRALAKGRFLAHERAAAAT